MIIKRICIYRKCSRSVFIGPSCTISPQIERRSGLFGPGSFACRKIAHSCSARRDGTSGTERNKNRLFCILPAAEFSKSGPVRAVRNIIHKIATIGKRLINRTSKAVSSDNLASLNGIEPRVAGRFWERMKIEGQREFESGHLSNPPSKGRILHLSVVLF